ncbi:MAG: hypothetical protein N2234_02035 [Planctomycetota bacterium]|nr:hypothetical protein [Planctomycetota bacterium]
MVKFFCGNFETKIDAKGRMMIPSYFREVAGKTEGLVLYAVPQSGDYIALMLEEEWQRLADMFTTNDPVPDVEEAENIVWFFSRMWRLVCDAQGRVVIPENLLKAVGMQRDCDVVIAGMQRWIGIWSRKRWEERIESKDKKEEEKSKSYEKVRERVKKKSDS